MSYGLTIQIVASSVFHIFDALAAWTKLRHLKLTNMAFPNGSLSGPHKMLPTMFCLTLAGSNVHSDMRRHLKGQHKPIRNTTLRSVHIGQTTFLDPELVAELACSPIFEALASVHVVDAYQGSIWGPRVRMGDILKAADGLVQNGGERMQGGEDYGFTSEREKRRERIKAIVKCSAERERIMGGDRMDGNELNNTNVILR